MRLLGIGSLSVGLSLVASAKAETPGIEEKKQTVYAAISLREGLPNFKPLEMMMPKETYSARIPYELDGYSIHFTWGRDGERNRFFLYLVYPDGTTTVGRFTLASSEDGALQGTVDFKAESDKEDLIPIAFRLLPEYQTLLYRWVGSQSSATGGRPAIKESPLKVGIPIPELTFTTIQGDKISTVDFTGQILVLNWWATTCSPCIAEMPDLNQLVERFQVSGQVEFIAIALDEPQKLDRFLQRHTFDYIHTLGSSEHTEIFGKSFPRHVVVNRDGVVAFDRRGAGPQTATEIGTAIQSLLAVNE